MPPVTVAFAGVLLALFFLMTVRSWRVGALLCLLFIYLEDLIRKAVPGQPGWMLLVKLAPIVVVYFAFLATLMRERGKGRGYFPLIAPVAALTGVVLIQSFNPGLIGYRVAIIGWLSHVFYIPFLFLGYEYFQSQRAGFRFFSRFGLLAIAVGAVAMFQAATGAVSSAGLFSPLIGDHQYHSSAIGGIGLVAGNFRGADILARHALFLVLVNLAVCLSPGRGTRRRLNWVGLAFAGLCLVFAGRRLLFYSACVGAVGLVWYKFRRGLVSVSLRKVTSAGLALFICLSVGYSLATLEYRRVFRYFWISLQSVPERGSAALAHNIRSVESVGWVGRGVGMASQGIQYVTHDYPRLAHGGPGQIWAEMGIMGVLAYLWLHLALIRRGARAVSRTADTDIGMLTFALFSFIVLCDLVFIQAHSMFDDGGTLMFFWFSAGVLLKAGSLSCSGRHRGHVVKNDCKRRYDQNGK